MAITLVALLGAAPMTAYSTDIYRSTQDDGTVVFTDQPDDKATLVIPDVIRPAPTSTATRSSDEDASEDDDAVDSDRVEDYGDFDRSDSDSDTYSGIQTDTTGNVAPIAPLPAATGTGTPADQAGATEPASSTPDTGDQLEADSGDNAAADPMAGVPIERVEIASPPPDAVLLDPAGPLIIEVGTAPGSLVSSGLVAEALVDGEVAASGASTLAVSELERGAHEIAVRVVNEQGAVVAESEPQMLHVRRTFTRPAGGNGS